MTAGTPRIHEIRLGLYATPEEAEEIKERVLRLLCPDPDHAPPCPVPWSVSLFDRSDGEEDDDEGLDLYPELVEQARAERAEGLRDT